MRVEHVAMDDVPEIVSSFRKKLPDIRHTTGRHSHNISRRVRNALGFGRHTSYYGGEVDISLQPSSDSFHTVVFHEGDTETRIPIHIDNVQIGFHTIDVAVGKVCFQMCEHILGVLSGLNVEGVEIHITSQNGGASWPMGQESVYQYASRLSNETQDIATSKPAVFTVANPTYIDFESPSGACALLLPSSKIGIQKMTYDINIDYPHNPIIGNRRIVYEAGKNNDFVQHISHARSNAFGWRNLAIHVPSFMKPALGDIWGLPRGISPGEVLEVYPGFLRNPGERYKKSPIGPVSEILYHAVLDKMGPDAIDLGGKLTGLKRVGTDVISKTSHAQDVEIRRMLSNGTIPVDIL